MGRSLARIAGATGDQGHNITGDAGRTLSGNTSIVTLEYAPGDWSAQ